MGGRRAAAEYLVSLEFGTDDVDAMMRRLSYWTNANHGKGQMGGNAVRALVNDRGVLPGDLDVLTPGEFEASIGRQDKAA